MSANYVLLGEVTVGSAGAASVTLSNIPQTGYTDLKVVYSARTSYSSNYSDPVLVTINSSTTTFSSKYLSTNGSSVYSGPFDRWVGNAANSNVTANTFGNSEIYFPNYLSSNNKSFSAEGASENNGTLTDLAMIAGLWSTTSAISTLQFTPLNGSFLANSTFSLYGLAAVGTTPVIAPFASGGDIITNDGTYWIHTFLSSGTFTPAKALTCDALVIAGGGGGNNGRAGGGAGGYRTVTGLSTTAQAYTITVGAGGAGGAQSAGTYFSGVKGSNSVFSTITSTGGGNAVAAAAGATGGSGGGGQGANAGGAGNEGGYSPVEGYAGGAGSSSSSQFGGGGGGGASAVGTAGSGSGGGAGGAGASSSITGSAVTRGGGGGGSGYSGGGSVTGGAGGAGGGGAGSNSASTAGTSGTANTGGGGGAGATSDTNISGGGAGGSGIVIIRYPIA